MTPTIKTTRATLMVTQEQMGRLMGMPQSSIARIEAGERSETTVHVAMLRMILVIAGHGLLNDLTNEHAQYKPNINKNNDIIKKNFA